MKTDLEELLNNINLTPTEILEYYLEEIDERFKDFNEKFIEFIPNYTDGNVIHYYMLQEEARKKPLEYEELVDMSENIGTIVNEFLSLYDLIAKNHNTMIYDLVSEKNDSFKFLKDFIRYHLYNVGGLSVYTMNVHASIKTLITYIKCQEEKEKISEKERLNEEKMATLEFFVDEFNRELDEKDARIHKLEAENKKLKLAKVLGD